MAAATRTKAGATTSRRRLPPGRCERPRRACDRRGPLPGRYRGRPGLCSLDPALFLEVASCAFMQRRRQSVLHHVFRIEVDERRMQLLELVEVVEHRL